MVPLEKLTLAELLELRGKIDALLPPRTLVDVDIEEELLLQFHSVKALYNRIAEDTGTPANQRAQVANSCTTMLDQLIKMQSKIFSAERIKALEQVLIRVLKTLPEAQQVQFFERYEQALDTLGVAKTAPKLDVPSSPQLGGSFHEEEK